MRNTVIKYFIFATMISLSAVTSSTACSADSLWVKIDEGLHHAQFTVVPASTVGDSRIDVIRIDPKLYRVEVKMISQTKDYSLTAQDWCKKYDLIAATNAGMFQQDFSTHVGYLRHDGHVNYAKSTPKYLSAAAFNPVDTTQPPFRIFDLDAISLDHVKEQY